MDFNTLILVEPERVENLYPFSIMHSSWELRCGCFRIFEKISNQFPIARIIYHGRDKHLNSFRARFHVQKQEIIKENVLIYNSTIVPTSKLLKVLRDAYSEFTRSSPVNKPVLFKSNHQIIALYLEEENIKTTNDIKDIFIKEFFKPRLDNYAIIELPEQKQINYLWDTLDLIADGIKDDSKFFTNKADFDLLKSQGVFLIKEEKILIGENTKIAPTAVLDASEGNIIIGNNVKIMPHTTIIGPCFIGDNSLIKAGAKIYEKTSIGEWCKVGGEIENSIIHAYSNKQHDGFLGHSYLGEWVNLGADTNTSDLKNTYSDIKIILNNHEINTGRMFLGLLCGDHSKSAINAMFTTGTVAGICGILLGDGFMPASIPSFSWGGKKDSPIYKVNKAIEVAKIVMARRNMTLLPEEETLIHEEYNRLQNK